MCAVPLFSSITHVAAILSDAAFRQDGVGGWSWCHLACCVPDATTYLSCNGVYSLCLQTCGVAKVGQDISKLPFVPRIRAHLLRIVSQGRSGTESF